VEAGFEDDVWRLFREGLSQREIARKLRVSNARVSRVIRSAGGFAPQPWERSSRALTPAERETISRGIAAGDSFRAIARELGRSVSVISREVGGMGGRAGYRAVVADQKAREAARRPKTPKLVLIPELAEKVIEYLRRRWSPEKIAHTLAEVYPDNEEMRVSHETIYRFVYIQTRGELKKELVRLLRQRHSHRKPKAATARARALATETSGGKGRIADQVSISERPAEAEGRAVPGFWEGDLILGPNGSAVATLVERHSRYLMMVALPENRTSEHVFTRLREAIPTLPERLAHDMNHHPDLAVALAPEITPPANLKLSITQAWNSITWDQGKEMSEHKSFTLVTRIPIYLCPPGQPWKRGTNENANSLIRHYLPKGTDLRPYNQHDLNTITNELNTRPRETLGMITPAQSLMRALASVPTTP
jgi:transposase, IS30 family